MKSADRRRERFVLLLSEREQALLQRVARACGRGMSEIARERIFRDLEVPENTNDSAERRRA